MRTNHIENGDKRRAALTAFSKLDNGQKEIVGDCADDLRILIKRQNPNVKIGRDDSLEILSAVGKLILST
jgi:hypothetical protein